MRLVECMGFRARPSGSAALGAISVMTLLGKSAPARADKPSVNSSLSLKRCPSLLLAVAMIATSFLWNAQPAASEELTGAGGLTTGITDEHSTDKVYFPGNIYLEYARTLTAHDSTFKALVGLGILVDLNTGATVRPYSNGAGENITLTGDIKFGFISLGGKRDIVTLNTSSLGFLGSFDCDANLAGAQRICAGNNGSDGDTLDIRTDISTALSVSGFHYINLEGDAKFENSELRDITLLNTTGITLSLTNSRFTSITGTSRADNITITGGSIDTLRGAKIAMCDSVRGAFHLCGGSQRNGEEDMLTIGGTQTGIFTNRLIYEYWTEEKFDASDDEVYSESGLSYGDPGYTGDNVPEYINVFAEDGAYKTYYEYDSEKKEFVRRPSVRTVNVAGLVSYYTGMTEVLSPKPLSVAGFERVNITSDMAFTNSYLDAVVLENGVTLYLTGTSILDSLTAKGAGNDALVLHGNITLNSPIDLGEGSDFLELGYDFLGTTKQVPLTLTLSAIPDTGACQAHFCGGGSNADGLNIGDEVTVTGGGALTVKGFETTNFYGSPVAGYRFANSGLGNVVFEEGTILHLTGTSTLDSFTAKGAGNDTLVLHGNITLNSSIDLGEGSDFLELGYDFSAAEEDRQVPLTLTLGAIPDMGACQAHFCGGSNADGLNLGDEVTITGGGALTVKGFETTKFYGSPIAGYRFANSGLGNVVFEEGTILYLTGTSTLDSFTAKGAGNDALVLHGNITLNSPIDLGEGGDVLELGYDVFGTTKQVPLTLTLGAIPAMGACQAHFCGGGSNADGLNIGDEVTVTGGGALTVKGFETTKFYGSPIAGYRFANSGLGAVTLNNTVTLTLSSTGDGFSELDSLTAMTGGNTLNLRGDVRLNGSIDLAQLVPELDYLTLGYDPETATHFETVLTLGTTSTACHICGDGFDDLDIGNMVTTTDDVPLIATGLLNTDFHGGTHHFANSSLGAVVLNNGSTLTLSSTGDGLSILSFLTTEAGGNSINLRGNVRLRGSIIMDDSGANTLTLGYDPETATHFETLLTFTRSFPSGCDKDFCGGGVGLLNIGNDVTATNNAPLTARGFGTTTFYGGKHHFANSSLGKVIFEHGTNLSLSGVNRLRYIQGSDENDRVSILAGATLNFVGNGLRCGGDEGTTLVRLCGGGGRDTLIILGNSVKLKIKTNTTISDLEGFTQITGQWEKCVSIKARFLATTVDPTTGACTNAAVDVLLADVVDDGAYLNINGTENDDTGYTLTRVTAANVNLMAGDDAVAFSGGVYTGTINGDAGKDTLTFSNVITLGAIHAGPGTDIITLNADADLTFIGTTACGGGDSTTKICGGTNGVKGDHLVIIDGATINGLTLADTLTPDDILGFERFTAPHITLSGFSTLTLSDSTLAAITGTANVDDYTLLGDITLAKSLSLGDGSDTVRLGVDENGMSSETALAITASAAECAENVHLCGGGDTSGTDDAGDTLEIGDALTYAGTLAATGFETTIFHGGTHHFANSGLGTVTLGNETNLTLSNSEAEHITVGAGSVGAGSIRFIGENTLYYVALASSSSRASIFLNSDALLTFAGGPNVNDCNVAKDGKQRFCGDYLTSDAVEDRPSPDHIDQVHIVYGAQASGRENPISPKTTTFFSGIDHLILENFESLGAITLGGDTDSGSFAKMGPVHALALYGSSLATSITGTTENDYVELDDTASVTATINGGDGEDWLYLDPASQIGGAVFDPINAPAPVSGFERLTLDGFTIGASGKGNGVSIRLGTGTGMFNDTSSSNAIRVLELKDSLFHGSITGSGQKDVILLAGGELVLDYINTKGGDDEIILGYDSFDETFATSITFNATGALATCEGDRGAYRICGGAGDDTLVIASTVTIRFMGTGETLANTTASLENCTGTTLLTAAQCLVGGNVMPEIADTGTDAGTDDCAHGVPCTGTENGDRRNIIRDATPTYVDVGAGDDIVTLKNGADTPSNITACGDFNVGICGGDGDNDWLVIEGSSLVRLISAAGFEITEVNTGASFAGSELGRVIVKTRDGVGLLGANTLNYVQIDTDLAGIANIAVLTSLADITFAGTDDCDRVKAGNQRFCGIGGTAAGIVFNRDGFDPSFRVNRVEIESGAVLGGTTINTLAALTSVASLFSDIDALELRRFTSLGAITLGASGSFGKLGPVHALTMSVDSLATSITGTAGDDYIALDRRTGATATTNAISAGDGEDWLYLEKGSLIGGAEFNPVSSAPVSGFERLTLAQYIIGASGSGNGVVISLGTGPGIFDDDADTSALTDDNAIRFLELRDSTFYGYINGSDEADTIIFAGGNYTLDYLDTSGEDDIVVLNGDSSINFTTTLLSGCGGLDVFFRICGGLGTDTLVIKKGARVSGIPVSRLTTGFKSFESLELRNFSTSIGTLVLGSSGLVSDVDNLRLHNSAAHRIKTTGDVANVISITGNSSLYSIDAGGGDDIIYLGFDLDGNLADETNIIFTSSALDSCGRFIGSFRICGGPGNDTLAIASTVTFYIPGGSLAYSVEGFETCNDSRSPALVAGECNGEIPVEQIGTEGNDVITFDGNIYNAIDALDGNDKIYVTGASTLHYINAGAGDDLVYLGFNAASNKVTTPITFTGAEGCGTTAAVRICGGAGNDTLIVSGNTTYAKDDAATGLAQTLTLTSLIEGFGGVGAAGKTSITPANETSALLKGIKFITPYRNASHTVTIGSIDITDETTTLLEIFGTRACAGGQAHICVPDTDILNLGGHVTQLNERLHITGSSITGIQITDGPWVLGNLLGEVAYVDIAEDTNLTLDGNFAANAVHGVSGSLTLTLTSRANARMVNAGGGTDTLIIENGAKANGTAIGLATTTLSNFENLELHDYTLTSGLVLGNSLAFNALTKTIRRIRLHNSTFTTLATTGNVANVISITGESSLQAIDAGGGDDIIYLGLDLDGHLPDTATTIAFTGAALNSCDSGRRTTVRICGGAGNDTLIIASSLTLPSGTLFKSITGGFVNCGAPAADNAGTSGACTKAQADLSEISGSGGEGAGAPPLDLQADLSKLSPNPDGDALSRGYALGFENLIFEFDLQLANALIPAVQSITRNLALSSMRQGGVYSGQRQLEGYQSATMKTFLAPDLTAEAGYEQEIAISEHGVGNTLWQSESGSQSLKAGGAMHVLSGELSSGEEGYEISGQASGFYLAYEAYALTMQAYALGAWFDIADTNGGSKTHHETIAEGTQLLFGGRVAFDLALRGLTLTPSATIFWQDTDMDADYRYLGREETTGMVALDAAWSTGALKAGLAYDDDYAAYEGGTQHYHAEPAAVMGFSQTLPSPRAMELRLEADWRRGLNTGRESGNVRLSGALVF